MSDEPIALAFARVVDLAQALGVRAINTLDGCWEHQVDEKWWVAVNGHREPVKCSTGAEVPPFHCYIESNGLPAGLLTPRGGQFMGNCEDGFIAAVSRAVEASRA